MADAATLPDSMLAPPGLPGADMTNIESVLGKIKQTQKAEDTDPAVKAARASQAATDDKGEKDIGDAYQKIEPYKPEKAPQAKDFQTSPLNQFGSVGSLFAVLASGFTHQPAINSMNAKAGAIKAVQAGDLEGYKTAYDAWKDNTQLALDRHKLQHEDYQDALSLAKTNTDLADAKLKHATAKYDDKTAEYYRELGQLDKLVEYNTARQNSALKIIELRPLMDEMHDKAVGLLSKYDEWFATDEGRAYKAAHPDEKLPPLAIQHKATLAVEREMTDAKSPYRNLTLSNEEAQAVEAKVAAGMPRDKAIEDVKKSSGGGGMGGANKQRYDQNMVRAGSEMNRLLGMISQQGVDTTGGIFEGANKGFKNYLTGRMQSENQGFFDSAFGGADVEIGNLLKNGLNVTEGTAKEMVDAFKPVPSDTNANALYKLANMAAKVKVALENTFPTDENAKASRDAIIEKLSSYPAPEDVYRAAQSSDPIKAKSYGEALQEIKDKFGEKAAGQGHKVGDVVTGKNGKKYRIVGGDMADPDVELVP